MRAERLTFGGRLLCPFLRPFSRRGRRSTCQRSCRIAVDPRRARGAGRHGRFDAARRPRAEPGRSGAGADRSRLSRPPARPLAPMRSCCRNRCNSPSTTANRPPAPDTASALPKLFDALPIMDALRLARAARVRCTARSSKLLDALRGQLPRWGGTASPPLDGDRRLARGAHVHEFELLHDAFTSLAFRRSSCDPRELSFATAGCAPTAAPIDSSTAAC